MADPVVLIQLHPRLWAPLQAADERAGGRDKVDAELERRILAEIAKVRR